MADRHREIRNRLYIRAVLHGIFAHVQIAVIEAGAEHANQYLAGANHLESASSSTRTTSREPCVYARSHADGQLSSYRA